MKTLTKAIEANRKRTQYHYPLHLPLSRYTAWEKLTDEIKALLETPTDHDGYFPQAEYDRLTKALVERAELCFRHKR